ncbi:hypothetical protein B0H16DRAFT_1700980 [Mycena metata]|uniref:Uncharacterized protein n=1 Tax=Mycena metata TaxID=1033252 RepID=A0AAD7HDC9_9AGAR|nr:hypothetical protein B0H16DRAFT_1700980 [Mycena metata]
MSSEGFEPPPSRVKPVDCQVSGTIAGDLRRLGFLLLAAPFIKKQVSSNTHLPASDIHPGPGRRANEIASEYAYPRYDGVRGDVQAPRNVEIKCGRKGIFARGDTTQVHRLSKFEPWGARTATSTTALERHDTYRDYVARECRQTAILARRPCASLSNGRWKDAVSLAPDQVVDNGRQEGRTVAASPQFTAWSWRVGAVHSKANVPSAWGERYGHFMHLRSGHRSRRIYSDEARIEWGVEKARYLSAEFGIPTVCGDRESWGYVIKGSKRRRVICECSRRGGIIHVGARRTGAAGCWRVHIGHTAKPGCDGGVLVEGAYTGREAVACRMVQSEISSIEVQGRDNWEDEARRQCIRLGREERRRVQECTGKAVGVVGIGTSKPIAFGVSPSERPHPRDWAVERKEICWRSTTGAGGGTYPSAHVGIRTASGNGGGKGTQLIRTCGRITLDWIALDRSSEPAELVRQNISVGGTNLGARRERGVTVLVQIEAPMKAGRQWPKGLLKAIAFRMTRQLLNAGGMKEEGSGRLIRNPSCFPPPRQTTRLAFRVEIRRPACTSKVLRPRVHSQSTRRCGIPSDFNSTIARRRIDALGYKTANPPVLGVVINTAYTGIHPRIPCALGSPFTDRGLLASSRTSRSRRRFSPFRNVAPLVGCMSNPKRARSNPYDEGPSV